MTDTPLHLRAAPIMARTLDREARSFEAVASTGADVPRPGFIERLPVGAADLFRLVGAPVLDAHRIGSTSDVPGVVDAARIEGGELEVTIHLSRRKSVDDVPSGIEGGVIRGVSPGYRIDAFKDQRGADGRITRTATGWPPLEIFLVPVLADPGATIRSQAMPDDQMTTPAPQTIPAATRSEINTQIRSIARVAGLDAARSDAQIDADAAAEAARAAAFDAMEARSAAPIRTTRASVGHDNDAPELRGALMGASLYAPPQPIACSQRTGPPVRRNEHP